VNHPHNALGTNHQKIDREQFNALLVEGKHLGHGEQGQNNGQEGPEPQHPQLQSIPDDGTRLIAEIVGGYGGEDSVDGQLEQDLLEAGQQIVGLVGERPQSRGTELCPVPGKVAPINRRHLDRFPLD